MFYVGGNYIENILGEVKELVEVGGGEEGLDRDGGGEEGRALTGLVEGGGEEGHS